MARLTVTVDLPTPPLPDDTPMTRVLESGPRNAGIGAAGACPWPAWSCPWPSSSVSGSTPPAMPARSRCRSPARSSSDITTNSRSTSSTPATEAAALMDRLGELLGAGPGGHREGDLNLHPAAARPHGAHQTEVAQRQADLRIPDRAHCSLEL